MTDDPIEKNSTADSGAYVLDALTPEERAAFESHLATSEDLRNEVTEMNDTAVLLGMAVDPVAPSAALKDSIMSQLSSSPQLPRDIPPVRDIRSAQSADAPAAQSPVTDSPATTRAKARWFRRPAAALTAAAAVVALLIGGGIAISHATSGTQQEQQVDAVAAIMGAPDHQSASADIAIGGTATLEWSATVAKCALVVHDLRTLPSGKTYELWYIDATTGAAKSAGTFNPSRNSSIQVLEGKMEHGVTVGVTVEPAGGSKQPTTKPIVAIASA